MRRAVLIEDRIADKLLVKAIRITAALTVELSRIMGDRKIDLSPYFPPVGSVAGHNLLIDYDNVIGVIIDCRQPSGAQSQVAPAHPLAPLSARCTPPANEANKFTRPLLRNDLLPVLPCPGSPGSEGGPAGS
jgi:hypothetical protein